MILSTSVSYVITKRTLKKFINKGFNDISVGEILEVPIDKMNKTSPMKVEVECDVCHTIKKIGYNTYITNIENGGYYSCSPKCGNGKSNMTKTKNGTHQVKKEKENIVKVYTDEEISEKRAKSLEKYKQTCMEKYGVDNPSKTNEVKEKIKKTMVEKYGVDNPMKNKEIQSKAFKTNMKRYGVDMIIKREDVVEKRTNILNKNKDVIFEKMKNTIIEKYGVDNVMRNPDIAKKVKNSLLKTLESKWISTFNKFGFEFISYNENDKIFELVSNICNHNFDINIDVFGYRKENNKIICTKCNPINSGNSSEEKSIINWLTELGIKVEHKKRLLDGLEIDIYLPDHMVGIEYNGLYWHSDIFREKEYHYKKYSISLDKNIDLIQIWEDEWLYKQNIIKSIILNKLGITKNTIYARKTKVEKINHNESKKFFDENHIQGHSPANMYIGLKHNDEIVSLMSFSERYLNSKKQYELVRFCNKIDTKVVGGASKLFKYFVKNMDINMDIISYSDNSKYDGSVYEQLGFYFDGYTPLNYYWCKQTKRYHRFNFNKKKLILDGYDPNKTENEIMHDRGYYKLWGVGQKKWIYKLNNLNIR